MKKPMVRIHNTESNEIIDREMTDAEFAHYTANAEAAAQMKSQADANSLVKAELLARLGITEDEAKLLLS